MASLVDIANFALGEVAEQTINTLEDSVKPAREAKRYIKQSIREVLAAGKWKCAREAAVLSQDATAPAFGWQYAYELPADFIRMVRFNDVDPDAVLNDLFEIRGTRIETDESICKIVYIEDLVFGDGDVGIMPPLMVKAVYLNLAAKLAWVMQQNRTLKEGLEEAAERALRRAKATDAQDEFMPLVDSSSTSQWIKGRIASTNG